MLCCARWVRLCSIVAAVVAVPLGASALSTLDFESLLNGEAGPFVIVAADATVTITGSGPNLGVAAFDTDPSGPNAAAEDLDLLVDTGIALILQDSLEPAITAGIFDVPDDDADGGLIRFLFSNSVMLQTIDLIDLNGNGPATVTLIDGSGKERGYFAPFFWTGDIEAGDVGIGTLDLALQADQVGVGPGNPLAIFSQDVGFDEFDVVQLDVLFDGSAALDTLTFIPEPGTMCLVGLGLTALAWRGRRRS